jgi:hypothetical protein
MYGLDDTIDKTSGVVLVEFADELYTLPLPFMDKNPGTSNRLIGKEVMIPLFVLFKIPPDNEDDSTSLCVDKIIELSF